jgi:magnesium-transporting ATPase (P-type)
MDEIYKKVDEYEFNYKRVNGLAIADVPKDKSLQDISLDDLNFCFVGLFTLTEDLYPSNMNCLEQLKNLNIKLVIYTGDRMDGLFSVMKKLEILNDSEKSSIREGGYVDEDENELVKYYDQNFPNNVVGLCRQFPINIQNFVKYLTKKGEKVAFVGDSTNEAPALTESAIAFAESHSNDMARSVSHFILTKSEALPVIVEVLQHFKTLK